MPNYKFETLQLHVGQETPDPATDARAVPIYATASYVFHDSAHAAARFSLEDTGNIYGRLTNSTQEVLEKRIAALEGGTAALALASGAAAIAYTLQALGQNNGHIVAQKTIYGGSYNLLAYTLPTFGITASFVDIHNLTAVEAAIQENTRAIYIETLGNPNSDIPDIDALSALAHKHGLPLVVDNTFGTPYLIRPIEHGADIVVHSATKFLGGHGTTLGGIIVDSGKFDWAASGKYPELTTPDESYHGVVYTEQFGKQAYITKARVQLMRDLGSTPQPLAMFILNLGLETLALRMERHCQNALAVAQYLEKHEKVSWVNYPGLPGNKYYELAKKYMPHGTSGVISFGVKGGRANAVTFMDSLKLAAVVVHVADARTSVLHPASTTHRQLTDEQLVATGITPDMVRLSVGIENVNDILADLEQALANI